MALFHPFNLHSTDRLPGCRVAVVGKQVSRLRIDHAAGRGRINVFCLYEATHHHVDIRKQLARIPTELRFNRRRIKSGALWDEGREVGCEGTIGDECDARCTLGAAECRCVLFTAMTERK